MHTVLATFLSLQAQGSDGLSFSEVLANIPMDPLSIFVYLALIGSGILIYLGSRSGGEPRPPASGGGTAG
jgi:hypothetical protein